MSGLAYESLLAINLKVKITVQYKSRKLAGAHLCKKSARDVCRWKCQVNAFLSPEYTASRLLGICELIDSSIQRVFGRAECICVTMFQLVRRRGTWDNAFQLRKRTCVSLLNEESLVLHV